MILGDVQQQKLAQELRKGLGYGRTRLNYNENRLGRGEVFVTRSAWKQEAPRGWYVTEEVKIGARGKLTRKRFTPPKSERTSKGSS